MLLRLKKVFIFLKVNSLSTVYSLLNGHKTLIQVLMLYRFWQLKTVTRIKI